MAEKTENNGQRQDNKVIVFLDNSARWRCEEDSEENQKRDISLISDEGRMLDVAWKIVYCSKIHLKSGQYQHTMSEVDDEHGKNRHVRIEGGDRDMP